MKYLLIGAALLLLTGCSESSKKEASKSAGVETEKVVAETVAAPESEAAETVNEPLEPPTKETVKEVTTDVAPQPATAPATASQQIEAAALQSVAATSDATALYAKCIACHGSRAEKSALGKSQIIAEWDADKIAAALKGYREGSYGGPMKALMQGQVKDYSDADIEAVAKHIESF